MLKTTSTSRIALPSGRQAVVVCPRTREQEECNYLILKGKFIGALAEDR